MNEYNNKLLMVLELLYFKYKIEEGKGRLAPVTVRIEKKESERQGLCQWEDVNGILPSFIRSGVIIGKRFVFPHGYLDVDLPEDFFGLYKKERKKILNETDMQTTVRGFQSKSSLVEFVPQGTSKGILKLPGIKEPLHFSSMPFKVINFFYNQKERKAWCGYKEIKKEIDESTEKIRKAIYEVNDRVSRATNKKITAIIETEKTGREKKKGNKYRWAL